MLVNDLMMQQNFQHRVLIVQKLTYRIEVLMTVLVFLLVQLKLITPQDSLIRNFESALSVQALTDYPSARAIVGVFFV